MEICHLQLCTIVITVVLLLVTLFLFLWDSFVKDVLEGEPHFVVSTFETLQNDLSGHVKLFEVKHDFQIVR